MEEKFTNGQAHEGWTTNYWGQGKTRLNPED
jgi:hypothetical protein